MRTARPSVRRAFARAAFAPAVALAGALAAACGADRATAPEAGTFDISRALAGAAAPAGAGVASFGAVALPAGVAAGLAGPAAAALRNCAWDAAAQTFACAPATAGGLTVTYGYTPLDARGAALSAPTRATVAAVRTVGTTRGTAPLPAAAGLAGGSYTVDARQETTVRGLLAGPRVVDGEATATTRIDAAGVAVRTRLTQTTAGLVLPSGGARWPAAGTVTTEVVEAEGGRLLVRQATTFDGTSTAVVVITAAGATQRCTIDLAAAAPAPRCTAAR